MKSFNSIPHPSSHRCRVFGGFAALALLCASASAPVLAVTPPPGGGYPNEVTALGDGALSNDTPGSDNTGLGFNALMSVTSLGAENTAVGSNALSDTTTGAANVAIGFDALRATTTGGFNVAVGYHALVANTTVSYNIAIGEEALQAHTIGGDNVAVGSGAMALGASGSYNTAIGSTAMAFANGSDNVAVGDGALNAANGNENIGVGQQACLNCAGNNNIAIGQYAGQSITTGANNILLGLSAGHNVTTGSNNIEIATQGAKTDSATIRIGAAATQNKAFIAGISGVTISGGAAVMVNSKGQLGVVTSSARYKEAIEPMKEASEAILSLEPVKFRYKKELDPEAIPQFGLVAEQVAKVDPDLVARDDLGKPYTVRYEAVNAMLLNEFLKEHRKVEEQAALNQRQEATIARLEAAMKEQAAQIQTVSAQVQASQPAPRVVSTGEH